MWVMTKVLLAITIMN